MKKSIHRLILVLLLSAQASCTTANDAYGSPRQVVEPGAVLIGAAAIGLIAYGLANSNRSERRQSNNHCSNNGYLTLAGRAGCGNAPIQQPLLEQRLPPSRRLRALLSRREKSGMAVPAG